MALFTPRLADGSRLELDVAQADLDRIMERRVGHGTSVVTDIPTGRRFRVARAHCGLGCECDARVLGELAPAVAP